MSHPLQPHCLAVDSHSRLYATDIVNERTVRLDSDGKVARSYEKDSRFPEHQPQGVAVDRDGNVFVADEGTRALIKFRADGVVEPFGVGYLQRPMGVAVPIFPYGSDAPPIDEVYVADNAKGTIVVFNGTTGDVLREFGKDGKDGKNDLKSPTDVAVASAQLTGWIELVFVVDKGNGRIVYYTSNGEMLGYLRDFDIRRNIDSIKSPSHVAVGPAVAFHGRGPVVYVTDCDDEGNRVLAFEFNLLSIWKLEIGRCCEMRMRHPGGLAACAWGFYVVDNAAETILRFALDDVSFSSVPMPLTLPSDWGTKHRNHNDKIRSECGECVVCTERLMPDDYSVVAARCGHRFHAPCIQGWLNSLLGNGNCPSCRHAVGELVSQHKFPDWLPLFARCALPLSARRALCAPMQLRL